METKRFPKVQNKQAQKCFAYLRVSGKGQIKGDGFPRQTAAIEAYAQANGLRIVQTFTEKAVSGTNEAEARPAWAEMMLALLADGVRTVIVETVNRLARDLMVQEHAIAQLRKAGFTLLSVAEPDLMATDPSRKMIRQILGSVAEYQKDELVLKLRAARVRKSAQLGRRVEGVKPYGTLQGEAEVLSLAQSLRKQGETYGLIASHLNEAGHLLRCGKPWTPGSVQQIFHNRAAQPTAEQLGAEIDAQMRYGQAEQPQVAQFLGHSAEPQLD